MKNMFNIYYINNEKASEISMLFDNQIVEKITRIKNTELSLAGDMDATTSAASKIPVIGQYLPSIDLNGNLSHSRSNGVEDTVKVVSSKWMGRILYQAGQRKQTTYGRPLYHSCRDRKHFPAVRFDVRTNAPNVRRTYR